MTKKIFIIIPIFILFGIAILFLILRGEVQENYFVNFDAAKKAGAIDAGWLPDILPESSTEIYEKHDLDTNMVSIRFKFDKKDVNRLVEQVKEVSPAEIDTINLISPSVLSHK